MNGYNFYFFVIGCTGVLLLSSCGKDYTNANLDRERDRQRENATILSKEYQTVAGSYATDSKDTSDYVINASIEVTYTQQDGTLVPQPTLTGKFVFNYKDPQSKGAEVPFPFSSGVYDAATGHFATTIDGVSGKGAKVTCDVQGDGGTLLCDWIPLSTSPRFQFLLKKTP